MDELLGAKASPSIEMVWGREEFGKFIDWMGLGSARERRSSQRHLELLPTSNTLDDAWNIFRIPVVDWGSTNCEPLWVGVNRHASLYSLWIWEIIFNNFILASKGSYVCTSLIKKYRTFMY